MIIEPFKINGLTLIDHQDLNTRQKRLVSLAIRDALAIFPPEYKCELLGKTYEGNYPIIILGVFLSGVLVGGWWLGCNTTTQGHTERNARIFSRPCPGPISKRTKYFWKGLPIVQIAKYLLNNKLITREGGTVEFVGLDYANDVRFKDGDGLGAVSVEVHDRLTADSEVTLVKIPLATGGFDIRVTKLIRRPRRN